MTNLSSPLSARAGSPQLAKSVAPRTAGAPRADSDLFLKRSAPYYHSPFFTQNSNRLSPLNAQRDHQLTQLIALLSPDSPHIDLESMRTRAKDARKSLLHAQSNAQTLLDKKSQGNFLDDLSYLQSKIDSTLQLEQEAMDNLHLLMRV